LNGYLRWTQKSTVSELEPVPEPIFIPDLLAYTDPIHLEPPPDEPLATIKLYPGIEVPNPLPCVSKKFCWQL
jgi:hypothetical protein